MIRFVDFHSLKDAAAYFSSPTRKLINVETLGATKFRFWFWEKQNG